MTSSRRVLRSPSDVGSDGEVFDITNMSRRGDKSQPKTLVFFQPDRGFFANSIAPSPPTP